MSGNIFRDQMTSDVCLLFVYIVYMTFKDAGTAPVEIVGPHAVRVVEVVDGEQDHSFELAVNALEKILLNPKIADKKVCDK